ncbi:sex hormone-binding globulin [Microcaecilia unicolor]|uniref:Sex hormone-binding globulin n=1 Tax=Microcaecilia unicolor TaxID=1415580 RepID=A0A6P7WT51_9AMPH|nr:sex hormone-binding globulin [Microcaecilia unicolor]
MKYLTGFLWLLALLWLNRGDVEEHHKGPVYSETCNLSQRTFLAYPDTLNIGQKWGKDEPTATVMLDLRQTTSSSSHFEIRTFDPEGVIFYGDTRDGKDWFLLGMRKGKLEIQVRNLISKITVSGGDMLNDGQWHQVRVINEGDTVLLEVDGEVKLSIGQVTEPLNSGEILEMRIAVGGILTNRSDLLIPMNTALDACFRKWKWLNQTSNWHSGPPAEGPGRKPCFSFIQRGSFFSGAGVAVFRTSEGIMPQDDWALTLEMLIRMEKRTGILVAFSVEDYRPLLMLRMKGQGFSLEFGNKTSLEVPFPHEMCLGFPLFLTISPTHLTWKLGDEKIELPVQMQDYQTLKTAWHEEGGRIFLGGPPNMERLFPTETAVFFEGCLSEIRLQGRTLDLDSALYKSDTVWAHSCPRSSSYGQEDS